MVGAYVDCQPVVETMVAPECGENRVQRQVLLVVLVIQLIQLGDDINLRRCNGFNGFAGFVAGRDA